MPSRSVILFVAISALALFGCQKGASENKPQNAAPSPNANVSVNSPPASPAAAPDKSKIKLYDGRGKITKIDLKLVSVELDHEEIKGLMPPMRMEFYVKEKAEIEVLKIGDEVVFVLEDNAGAERIVSIKKAQPEP